MDVRDVQGKKMLKVRNPWGKGEWTGDYSDNSLMWSARSANEVQLEKVDDGMLGCDCVIVCIVSVCLIMRNILGTKTNGPTIKCVSVIVWLLSVCIVSVIDVRNLLGAGGQELYRRIYNNIGSAWHTRVARVIVRNRIILPVFYFLPYLFPCFH